MKTPPPVSEHFHDGGYAWMIGKDRLTCPYPRNTWAGEEWTAGWWMAWAINEAIVRNGGEDGREAWKRINAK